MPDQPNNQNQLNIEISEEVAEGQYANLVIITHSHAEFVIDFFKSGEFMCWTINPDSSLTPARWESLLAVPDAIQNVLISRQLP